MKRSLVVASAFTVLLFLLLLIPLDGRVDNTFVFLLVGFTDTSSSSYWSFDSSFPYGNN